MYLFFDFLEYILCKLINENTTYLIIYTSVQRSKHGSINELKVDPLFFNVHKSSTFPKCNLICSSS